MAVSEEERRARNAAKNRAYRARKAAEREAARAERVSHAGNVPAGTVVRDATDRTIAALKWLTAADEASVAQARTLARRIDLLEHEDETTKALSAHRALSQILNDLGATATKRQQYELRSRRLTPEEGDGDERDPGEGGETPANVTKLQRPARRAR